MQCARAHTRARAHTNTENADLQKQHVQTHSFTQKHITNIVAHAIEIAIWPFQNFKILDFLANMTCECDIPPPFFLFGHKTLRDFFCVGVTEADKQASQVDHERGPVKVSKTEDIH